MIIITGASGTLGRSIVGHLLTRVPVETLGVSVRDPAKVADLAARGVRVRQGDFADPASLGHSFAGASQVLIVSSNARAQGGDPLAQHRAAIKAAVAVGTRRIVYTSHMGVSDVSAFPPMHDHHATEAMLRDCGVPYTVLRNGFYAASGLMLMGDALASGRIAAPEDGKVAWTAHDDLAAGAAAILADEGCIDGPTPPLTGAEALDLADLAHLATDAIGREVRRDTLTDDAFRAGMAARGLPAPVIAITLGLYAASRAGEFARLDPTLERLIGRPPLRMADLIARKAAG